mgnify:CR=1 FL=1
MGTDKNTLIGFALIGALLIGMFVINNNSRSTYDRDLKSKADSIAAARPKTDSLALKADMLKSDSLRFLKQPTAFGKDTLKHQMITAENDVMKVIFNTRGAQPACVELKKYKKYDSTQVVMQSGDYNTCT